MLQWLHDVWKNFVNPVNFLDLIIPIIIAIVGTKIAIDVISDYKEKQLGALWSFHAQLSVFLTRLKKAIESPSFNRIKKYFYQPKPVGDDINNNEVTDIAEIAHFANLSKDFLYYLSTANNQIPPTSDLNQWKNDRDVLVDFLFKASFFGIRINEITEDNLEEKLENIKNIIIRTENDIVAVEIDLKINLEKINKRKNRWKNIKKKLKWK